jgi:UPF0755 protein
VDQLVHDGVLDSSLAFRIYEAVHGTPAVQPGDHLFHRNQSFASVHSALGGPADVFYLTVPVGFTLAEIGERLEDVTSMNRTDLSEPGFVRALHDGAVRSPYAPAGSTDLEGLVAAGTYELLGDESDTQLVRQMVDRFDAEADAAGLPGAATALGLTRYQVAVIASIVEKEGYIPANMGRVARVIVNRLADGMPLQMDSTVLYAIGQDGGPVTPADEQLQSPYNTYLNTGLPPTPICVPGPAALSAAAHPSPGGWLYFELVDKDGVEAFADTYAEQLANEALAASRGLG